LVLIGTVIQQVVIGAVAGGPAPPAIRAVNVASYFSIESDALVGLTCLLLAIDPRRNSPLFRVFRFTALVAIIVSSLVYHVLFVKLVHFTGWGLVGDQILHTAVPILAVTGWLCFGPRGLASWRVAGLSALYPLSWLVFTAGRGALTGWYPYPFIDPSRIGYAAALRNVGLLSVFFLVVTAAATVADRWLTGRRCR
jgi:hypothetical protein